MHFLVPNYTIILIRDTYIQEAITASHRELWDLEATVTYGIVGVLGFERF